MFELVRGATHTDLEGAIVDALETGSDSPRNYLPLVDLNSTHCDAERCFCARYAGFVTNGRVNLKYRIPFRKV